MQINSDSNKMILICQDKAFLQKDVTGKLYDMNNRIYDLFLSQAAEHDLV